MENIYNLKLHRGTMVDGYVHVTRVPGGWIYSFIPEPEWEDRIPCMPVFVPFDNEFQNKD